MIITRICLADTPKNALQLCRKINTQHPLEMAYTLLLRPVPVYALLAHVGVLGVSLRTAVVIFACHQGYHISPVGAVQYETYRGTEKVQVFHISNIKSGRSDRIRNSMATTHPGVVWRIIVGLFNNQIFQQSTALRATCVVYYSC